MSEAQVEATPRAPESVHVSMTYSDVNKHWRGGLAGPHFRVSCAFGIRGENDDGIWFAWSEVVSIYAYALPIRA